MARSLGSIRARTARARELMARTRAERFAVGAFNVDNEISDLGIEAYLNLDHAPSVVAAEAAVDAGFEFIHLDAFQADPDASAHDVVSKTRKVVAYARRTGALVEGEQRYLTGS